VEAIEALNWMTAESRQDESAAILAGFFLDEAATAAGSSEQREVAKWFSSSALDPDSLERVRAFLAGSATIPGLEPDREMRWAWMRALARRGAIGAEEIGAERDRDPTERGWREYHACVASRPDSSAKEVAWRTIVGDELGVRTQQAVMSAFHQPRQRAVLEPFVDRYFTHLDTLLAQGVTQPALAFARGMFPLSVPGEKLTAQTTRFLAEHEAAPGMEAATRLVRDGLDEASRRLRCQERDGDGARSPVGRG